MTTRIKVAGGRFIMNGVDLGTSTHIEGWELGTNKEAIIAINTMKNNVKPSYIFDMDDGYLTLSPMFINFHNKYYEKISSLFKRCMIIEREPNESNDALLMRIDSILYNMNYTTMVNKNGCNVVVANRIHIIQAIQSGYNFIVRDQYGKILIVNLQGFSYEQLYQDILANDMYIYFSNLSDNQQLTISPESINNIYTNTISNEIYVRMGKGFYIKYCNNNTKRKLYHPLFKHIFRQTRRQDVLNLSRHNKYIMDEITWLDGYMNMK